MDKQHISENLKSFVKEQIRTVSRLELLLLLHHHQPRELSLAEVASKLGFEEEAVEAQLAELEAIALVTHSNGDQSKYKYDPRNSAVRSMVDELAAKYFSQPVPVLSMILSEHPDRIRLFAEAFRMIRETD